VANTFKEAEFVLVGDGMFRPEFERMAVEMGLASRVRFLGECNNIPAALASLDISVVPSISESLPNVVLESMAAGVPVVATRVGGIPDVLEHKKSGLLVPPEDDLQMAEAIGHLIVNPVMRQEIALNARQYAANHFHWNSVSEQYEELYAKTLARKERRSRSNAPSPAEKEIRKRRLRIALVGPSLRQLGGQSVQVDRMLREWYGDADIDVSFVPIDPAWRKGWGMLGRIPYLRTLVRGIRYSAILRHALRETDIAHVFVGSYASFLIVLLPPWFLARTRGAKLLVHYHSGEAQDHLSRSWLARYLLRKAASIVVPSGYLVDVFGQFSVKATAVSNIIGLDEFTYRRRARFGPSFICTRGFHPYYRIDDVLRSFAEIQRELPSARLILVGGGQTETQMRHLAEELRLKNVEFRGVVPHSQIGECYEQADIFINASVVDNMPVSILEAFASGTPVVTTAAHGIPYIVEHERTGLLSAPGDWKSLAQNALRLLREPELAQRIAANAHEELQRYRWENVRPQWLAVYRNAVGDTNRSATKESSQLTNYTPAGA
jgi:L-malate glycosyltransferase